MMTRRRRRRQVGRKVRIKTFPWALLLLLVAPRAKYLAIVIVIAAALMMMMIMRSRTIRTAGGVLAAHGLRMVLVLVIKRGFLQLLEEEVAHRRRNR